MSTIHDTAIALADLCQEKHDAYGDSIGKSAELLALLYPNGLRPDQYLDAIMAARDFDKRARLAQGNDPHGEDPRLDIAGYALKALHYSREGATKTPCGSVSAEDAAKKSPAPSDSAEQSAAPLTTPSASEPLERNSETLSSLPSPSTSAKSGALASTAMAAALFESANVKHSRLKLIRRQTIIEGGAARNFVGQCAFCGCNHVLDEMRYTARFDTYTLYFDLRQCLAIFDDVLEHKS